MKLFFIFVSFLMLGCSTKSPSSKKQLAQRFEKWEIAFETTEGILHPESAYYSHQHQSIFVSNLANGNPFDEKKESFISQLSSDGKVIKLKWFVGLRAPKGITVFGNHLYVADVDRVLKIDIKTAKIVKSFPVPYAKFLNDVTHDAQGNIYISDMKDDVIYKISNNKMGEWIKDTRIYSANGLFTDGKEHMFVAKWGVDMNPQTFETKYPGSLAMISLKDPKKIDEIKEVSGHLDGVDTDHLGNLWISDWMNGNIFRMTKQGKVELMYNGGQGAADISVAKELKLLLVPQMYQNKVLGIKIPQ